LDNLNERHPGVSAGLALSYSEAAAVCLSRHHDSPVGFDVTIADESATYQLGWIPPDENLSAAWANEIDATEAGAYCVALATVEKVRELVAISRAETRTGADYLLVPLDSLDVEDFENVIRLEVSGTDGDNATVRRRIVEKVEQAKRGESDTPAMAVVVGFKVSSILLADVEAA
jgi:hypothetical protein